MVRNYFGGTQYAGMIGGTKNLNQIRNIENIDSLDELPLNKLQKWRDEADEENKPDEFAMNKIKYNIYIKEQQEAHDKNNFVIPPMWKPEEEDGWFNIKTGYISGLIKSGWTHIIGNKQVFDICIDELSA